MEDLAKKKTHSVPSIYVTLQQLQERRLREQKQREEEEEERERQLQKQKEEEEKKEKNKKAKRERRHPRSAQTQRIKDAGRTEKKISKGGIRTLDIEGEIEGRKGEVENSNKGKKDTEKRKGKGIDKQKQKEGSAFGDHGEIVEKLASMNVSGHEKMDGADGLDEKWTGGKRREWRAKTLLRVTAIKGERTAEENGSDEREGDFSDARGRRKNGAGRKPDRSKKKSLRQLIEVKIGSSADADEADAKTGGRRIELVGPTVVLDDSDEADERSAAENKGASPMKKLLRVAGEMESKSYGADGVYAGSTVKIRSYRRCRYRGGMMGRAAAKDRVWVRRGELSEDASVLPHGFGGPATMAGGRDEVRTPKPRV